MFQVKLFKWKLTDQKEVTSNGNNLTLDCHDKHTTSYKPSYLWVILFFEKLTFEPNIFEVWSYLNINDWALKNGKFFKFPLKTNNWQKLCLGPQVKDPNFRFAKLYFC